MRPELVGVGVEAVERGVEDPRPEPGLDDLGDQLEPAGQAVVGVLRPVRRWLGDLLEPLAGVVGREGAPPHEPEQGVVRPAGRAGRPGRGPRAGASGRSPPASWSRYCSRLSSEGTSVRFDFRASGKARVPTCRAGESLPAGRGRVVEGPAEPAGLERIALEPGRLPDLHRPEVRAVGVGVADPLDHREPPLLEQLGHLPHRGVEADLLGDLVDRPRGAAARGAPWRSRRGRAGPRCSGRHCRRATGRRPGSGRSTSPAGRLRRSGEEARHGRRAHRDQGAGRQRRFQEAATVGSHGKILEKRDSPQSHRGHRGRDRERIRYSINFECNLCMMSL